MCHTGLTENQNRLLYLVSLYTHKAESHDDKDEWIRKPALLVLIYEGVVANVPRRRPVAFLRRRRDSCPSHDDVDGLNFDVERISGEIAPRYMSHAGLGLRLRPGLGAH